MSGLTVYVRNCRMYRLDGRSSVTFTAVEILYDDSNKDGLMSGLTVYVRNCGMYWLDGWSSVTFTAVEIFDHLMFTTLLHPSPPSDNIRVMMIVGSKEGILSEQLCVGLCDTLFTVSSTLI